MVIFIEIILCKEHNNIMPKAVLGRLCSTSGIYTHSTNITIHRVG